MEENQEALPNAAEQGPKERFMEWVQDDVKNIESEKCILKRSISNKEFEGLKTALIKAFDSDKIPVFNPEWERFSKNQAKEIENIIRYGEGVESWFDKLKSFSNMVKFYRP